ncbi:MAG: PAS domain S-box protein [Chloroflexi bacterium]|nr:PAS domain S-box protein [Chloroflexota bacterium]
MSTENTPSDVTPLRILHLEDDTSDAELVQSLLESNGLQCNIHRVQTRADFVAALEQHPFDLILSDYALPSFDGSAALEIARQTVPNVPFIFLSGTIGEEVAVDSLRNGAVDYVLKDGLHRLVPAVRRALNEAREHAVLQRIEQQVRLQSAALESVANSILITDAQGSILWVNPAFTAITGYAAAEVIGRNPRILKSDRQDAAFYQRLWQTILSGQVWQGEVTNRRKDGSLYIEEMTITPLRDARGTITHYVAAKQDVTERKRSEDALRESELRYRMLFEGAAEGILVADVETKRFTHANSTVCKMFGYTQDEMMRLGVADVHPRPDLPRVISEFEAHVFGQEKLAADIPCQRKDGTVFYADIHATSVVLDGQRCNVGFFTDITERKRAEAHIHHLNQLLRAIRDINKLIVRERSPERLLAEACKILVQTRGYRLVWIGRAEPGSKRVVPVASAGSGSEFLEVFPVTWDETATGLGPIGTALRTRQPWTCQNTATDPRFAPWRESVLARSGGSVAAVPMIHGRRLFGAVEIYADRPAAIDGEELGLLIELAGDLAFAWQTIEHEQERKRVEEALRESEARFRQVVEASPVPLLVEDTARNLEYLNRKFVETFGYTHEDIATSADWFARAFPNPGYRQTVAERWSASLRKALHAGKDIGPLEVEVTCKDGSVRTVELLGTIGGGRCLIAASDITEKKRLEAQFLRNQRMETIGTLAGGIAHDLNNILAPILMSVPILREKLPSGEGADLLKMMETSAQRGANVVRQLLTFGRGVTGERVRVQARHLIKEVVKMARQTFPKSIAILSAVPADLWLVLGDATQLQQVLLNLCVNARDAMPEGGRLTLEAKNVRLAEEDAGLKPEAKAGPYVLLRVSDTGHGIPPEILDRIFDPFFTTKEHGKGTGLGLSTVLGIVKSHGGFVRVESQVALGSAFEVYLPAVPEAEPLPDASKPPTLAPGQGELILVVDDEAAIRETTQRMLKKHGYDVLTAAGGREALTLYEQRGYAIQAVLTDLMMPGMDGSALSRGLLALNPQVKIVAASGLGEDAKVAELKALGVKAFLSKPYATDKLFDILREMLQEESGLPPAP